MDSNSETAGSTQPAKNPTTWWLVKVSAYWFATSYKWFLILIFLLPGQVADIVPGGEKSAYWGTIFGLGAIWAIFGPALFGNASDRGGGPRPYILIGSLCTVFAVGFLYMGNSILALTFGYLALQVSDDIATGPYSAIIPQMVPKALRGKASGIMGMAMSLSQVVAVAAALTFVDNREVLYGSIAGLNVLGALVVAATIGKDVKLKPERGAFFAGWLDPWKDRDFRAVWFTRFFATLAFYLVVPYVNFYIRDVVPNPSILSMKFDSPSKATGVLALTMAVTGAVGALVAGYLADKFGRKKITYAGAAMMGIALALLIPLPDLTQIWYLTMILGTGYGAFQAANWAMVSDVLPDLDSAGRDMGIWQMSISSVQVVAGAAGFLVTFGNGLGTHLGYQLLFVVATLAVCIGAISAKFVRSTS